MRLAAWPSTRRLGEEGVGLGLQVGDLGLELEPQDLAPDGGSGGAMRPASAGSPTSSGYSPLIHDRRRLR